MIEINLPSGTYIFKKCQSDKFRLFEDYSDFNGDIPSQCLIFGNSEDSENNRYIYLGKPNSFQIISTTNDITEEQCKDLIEYRVDRERFKDYEYYIKDKYSIGILSQWDIKTAKESFQSLLQANNLTKSNYLILKKL